jgi:hypothetical protein
MVYAKLYGNLGDEHGLYSRESEENHESTKDESL